MPILRLENVCKAFPGVQALDNVSLEVQRGEIRALLGQNGAGKSTLVKVLSGAITRDSGKLEIDGRSVDEVLTPTKARELGIALIYQELSLLPHLSVAENIYLGKEPLSAKFGRIIDYQTMYRRAEETLAQLQATSIPVRKWVADLSLPEQQIVEIAKAIAVNCKILIMDEPTTSLTTNEVSRLFDVVRALRDRGVTIIYISHRLDEVFQLCDTATVLRDGRTVGTVRLADSSPNEVIAMMTGSKFEVASFDKREVDGNPLLSVRELADGGMIRGVSFDVLPNEVLGLAGLIGSGRTESVKMIFGAMKKTRGEVEFDGTKVNIRSPRDAIELGIGYLSENRKEEGLNLGLTVEDNIILTGNEDVSRHGVLVKRRVRALAERFIAELSVKGGPTVRVVNLSGGNQQKVAIAKWLQRGCRLLFFDEPTRGVDVASKAEIHGLIRQFATEGRAAVVISSEVEELATVCDRVIVFSRGELIGELVGEDVNKERLLQCTAGGGWAFERG